MGREIELSFAKKMFEKLDVAFTRFAISQPPAFDRGLREVLGFSLTENRWSLRLEKDTLNLLTDSFACSYAVFRIPQSEEALLIGPYISVELSDADVATLMQRHNVTPHRFAALRRYYNELAHINDNVMNSLLYTLGDVIWGDEQAYTVRRVESRELSRPQNVEPPDARDIQVEMAQLERRYEFENRFMYAVSHGMTQTAVRMMSKISIEAFEKRVSDPIRNTKNYMIICNTILRKAAEQGGVHPYHLDRLSSSIAKKIEEAHAYRQLIQLQETSIKAYCELVTEHSTRAYSPFIRSIVLRVDSDLSGDQSLAAHAQALNVNPSYLSTRFKSETGTTLTEYVSHRRMEYAAFLLEATDMQIQAVAQYAGILDANYFSKLFKQLKGSSPKDYRTANRTH